MVLCSPSYGATPWTFRVIQLADNEGKKIVAVRHSGTFPPQEVKIFLGGEQRVPRGNNPLTHASVDFDAAVSELVKALRRKSVLPASSSDEAAALFKEWDRNGDGALDAYEILIGCLQLGMDPEDVSALFARLVARGICRVSRARHTCGRAVRVAEAAQAGKLRGGAERRPRRRHGGGPHGAEGERLGGGVGDEKVGG